MIRLKFQNKSTDELILVRDEDPNIEVDEGDAESVCTLQVCENKEESHVQELQKIVEASHKILQKQNEEMKQKELEIVKYKRMLTEQNGGKMDSERDRKKARFVSKHQQYR